MDIQYKLMKSLFDFNYMLSVKQKTVISYKIRNIFFFLNKRDLEKMINFLISTFEYALSTKAVNSSFFGSE